MAKHPLSKREEERQVSRRALIKWSVAAGAALGVSRAKIFEILEKTAGKDLAFAAAANPTTRSVHFNAGNGGLAWMTQFWPMPGVANAGNASLAWNFPGKQTTVAGTGVAIAGSSAPTTPLVVGPVTPWLNLTAPNQMTCFFAGDNQTHTAIGGNVASSVTTLNGSDIFAIATALQVTSPSVVPVVSVAGTDVGTAAGAPSVTGVTSGAGIVDLFNSAASQAGGMLAKASDATFYTAQYNSFIQLQRAANRSTTKLGYQTATGAASLLGTNLSSILQITAADQTRYGLTSSTVSQVTQMAETLIVTAKAFKAGLTNCVLLPFDQTDPHGAYDSGTINTTPQQYQAALNAFMADLASMTDENTGETLSTDTVISWHGDTFKDPTTRAGWPDGTPTNSNIVFMYSAGYLAPGWWGSINSAATTVTGFDVNGAPATYNGTSQATSACASLAYAIAKGDERSIQTFANGVNISA
jgi:hypothetical protein